MRNLKITTMCLALPILAGCGGGGDNVDGGNPVTNYVGFFNTSSLEQSDLEIHSIDPATGSVSSADGTLDRENNRIKLDLAGADINASRTEGVWDAGGYVTFESGPTSFVTKFTSQPFNGSPVFGVVGIPTEASDLPRGTTEYSGAGSASVQVIDGNSVFDLTGSASVVVNFDNNDVDMTFESLDGTRATGSAAPTPVTNVGTITINNANVSNGSFSGGDAGLSSTQISNGLTGSESTLTSGGFYGPGADEVGGAFMVNDTAGAGSLLIEGWFTAD